MKPDPSSLLTLAPGVRLQTDSLSGEPLLVFPEGVLFLNSTAHDIVCRCDGTNSASQIISAMAQEYEASEGELREDVLECLENLLQRRLLIVRGRQPS